VIRADIDDFFKQESGRFNGSPDIVGLHAQFCIGTTRLIQNPGFFPGTAMPVNNCKVSVFLQNVVYRFR